MHHIGFTGTQKGMTQEQKKYVRAFLKVCLDFEKEITVHHRDCVGADVDFHDIAKEFGFKIHIHPPIKSYKRAFKKGDFEELPKEYLERNHDIVLASNRMIAKW